MPRPGLPGIPPVSVRHADGERVGGRDAGGVHELDAVAVGAGCDARHGESRALCAGRARREITLGDMLKKAGYATDPAYASKLSNIIAANKRARSDAGYPSGTIPVNGQIGTVYKTNEEQLSYLNATRKTNPMLFQALKQQLGQQQAVAR